MVQPIHGLNVLSVHSILEVCAMFGITYGRMPGM